MLVVLLLLAGGCGPERLEQLQRATIQPPGYHLHLNGIGGYRNVDRHLLAGLKDGGLDADAHVYDWTGADVGLVALLQHRRHAEQSKKVSEMIEQAAREAPGRRITLSAHSAGAGILAWALEQLPAEVTVDSIVLLAPALSPRYDLSRALSHVSGKVHVFYSPYDGAVLGVGTRMFGTIDGVKTDAAGRVGFRMPEGADEAQYEKLVQVPYDSTWMKLGNLGDHVGVMSRAFARQILAPALLDGVTPVAPQQQREDPLTLPPPPATSQPAVAPLAEPTPPPTAAPLP